MWDSFAPIASSPASWSWLRRRASKKAGLHLIGLDQLLSMLQFPRIGQTNQRSLCVSLSLNSILHCLPDVCTPNRPSTIAPDLPTRKPDHVIIRVMNFVRRKLLSHLWPECGTFNQTHIHAVWLGDNVYFSTSHVLWSGRYNCPFSMSKRESSKWLTNRNDAQNK
jgi:hypothetical protein